MTSKQKKNILKGVCIFLAAVIIIAVSYLMYVILSYDRLADNLSLEVSGTAEKSAPVNKELSLLTYNIGFGAYSPDYSFFMDGGKYSRALSKDAVITNTNGALETVRKENPDFVLFQEVDTKGTRSYKVDQTEILKKGLNNKDFVYAENYNSPYFLYPFNQPIGANKSGLMTFSSFDISSATRRSLPIENSFYKYLDLDRAYTKSVIKTDNGKLLYVYNIHLSAYTSDGTIANEQLKMLGEDMQAAFDGGNYIIAAGDFNKDMLGDSGKYFKRPNGEFNWAKPFNSTLLPKEFTSHTGANAPTCRNADSPFKGDGTDFVLSVDGFLTSSNIKVTSCQTVNNKFAFSDHNPVKIEFSLVSE